MDTATAINTTSNQVISTTGVYSVAHILSNTKGRIETIALSIAESLTKKDINAAIRYLASEAARAEAEIVNTTQQAQRDITDIISSLKPKDLAAYKLKSTKDKSSSVLGKMVADCKILSERIITANILSGKFKAALHAKPNSIDELALSKSDKERIARLVIQSMQKIKSGADLSLSSLNTLLQTSASKASIVSGDKEDKKEDEKIKQEPTSNQFSGESVASKRANRILREVIPTSDELAKIKSNPIQYTTSIVNQNLTVITTLHNNYLKMKNEVVQIKENPKATIADKVSIELVQNIRKNGLYAFMDKGGKRWTLETYCVMIARTTATLSTNAGEVFSDDKHDLYYLVPHQGSCPLCKKYEGRVYSKSGKDKRYPPLASIMSKVDKFGTDDLDNTYLSIHPNCRHKLIRYYRK